MSDNQSAKNSPVHTEPTSPISRSAPATDSSHINPFIPQPNDADMDIDSELIGDVPLSADDGDETINLENLEESMIEVTKETVQKKKIEYHTAVTLFLKLNKANPKSVSTRNAAKAYKEAQKQYNEAEALLRSILPEPVAVDSKVVLPMVETKKPSRVVCPNNLPFLQLKSDEVFEKPDREKFDSVYDFWQEFVTILEMNALSLDDNWERLLPSCLSKEEISWCEDKLKGKNYKWKEAESILLDHVNTPYRKFLNMGCVWTMKQGESENPFVLLVLGSKKLADKLPWRMVSNLLGI